MKKIILIGLVVLGFVAFFFLQRSNFEYAEQIQIAKSKSEVFNHINDPKNWKTWFSIKTETDSWEIESESSPSFGDGATVRVVSAEGVLKAVATIVQSIPENLVKVKVSYVVGTATKDVYFAFNIKDPNNTITVESVASGNDRRISGILFAGILKNSLVLLKNTIEN